MPGYANPQSLNRYSYVLNNPLRYTDPTGHMEYEGNEGKRGSNCKKYSKYCNGSVLKSQQELAKMRREKEIKIPSYVAASFDLYPNMPIMSSPQCPGYCNHGSGSSYGSVSIDVGSEVGSFVQSTVQSYAGGAWSFEEMARPLGSNPDIVSQGIYVVTAGIEAVGNGVAGAINMVLNSNGPSINTNPLTPTSSPTQPTWTPGPTATGVTPILTSTPSPSATSTLWSTPSATLSVDLTSVPTTTTTTTPVYWVP